MNLSRLYVLLLLGSIVPTILSFSESLYHEELYKKVEGEDELNPVFLTDEPLKQLFSTSKHCLRQSRPQKRSRSVAALAGNKSTDIFVSTWMDFMNEFYWDNGKEYTKWTHISEGLQDSDKEPWYMRVSFVIIILLYILSMLVTGILAPFIAFILFRTFHLIWILMSHNRSRNILRRLWTNNELRKRRQVLMIYMWAKKVPKIRAKLPWILRRNPDEEVPKELVDLIGVSSSPESSMGEDNLDYYYEGMEKEGHDAIEANKAKLQKLEQRRKQSMVNVKDKLPKKIVPWRKGHKSALDNITHTISAFQRLSMAQPKIDDDDPSISEPSEVVSEVGGEEKQGEGNVEKVNSDDSFHV